MSDEPLASGTGPLDDGVLTARRLLEWRLGGTTLPRLPEAVVLTHQVSLLRRRRRFALRRTSKTPFAFETLSLAGVEALIVAPRGIGAPAAAVAVEELAVAGVRRLIVVDVAGSIDASAPGGSIVIIEGAIAGDGTSSHYGTEDILRPDVALTASLRARLHAAGLPVHDGLVWSTDAVFRETPLLVEKYRTQGALVVDMETAAVLAVSRALGIEAAAVLVAADELFDGWRPPSSMQPIRDVLQRLVAEAALVLQQ